MLSRYNLVVKLIKLYIKNLFKNLKFYLLINKDTSYTVTAVSDNIFGILYDENNKLVSWENYSYNVIDYPCLKNDNIDYKEAFKNGLDDLILLGQMLPTVSRYDRKGIEVDYLFLDSIRMIDVSFKNKTYRIEIIDDDYESVKEVFDKPHISLTNCILENKFYNISDRYFWSLFEYNKVERRLCIFDKWYYI